MQVFSIIYYESFILLQLPPMERPASPARSGSVAGSQVASQSPRGSERSETRSQGSHRSGGGTPTSRKKKGGDTASQQDLAETSGSQIGVEQQQRLNIGVHRKINVVCECLMIYRDTHLTGKVGSMLVAGRGMNIMPIS